MTPPIIRIGWQTDQAANSKDLSFRLNPGYFQSNPRIGKNTGYVAAPTVVVAPSTVTQAVDWYLSDAYDQPSQVPISIPAPAAGTPITIQGSKYCVSKGDYGVQNALRFGDTLPHLCSAGNVA
jgi:hypothetical protein